MTIDATCSIAKLRTSLAAIDENYVSSSRKHAMKLTALAPLLVLAGCASGAPDIDVAQGEATCVRWCAAKHPSCAFDGAIVEHKTEALHACQKDYMTCVKSCPPR